MVVSDTVINIGAIVGGVIGGILGVGVMGYFIYKFHLKRSAATRVVATVRSTSDAGDF